MWFALLPILATRADWPAFRVSQVDMAFKMPSKPQMKQAMFKNAPAVFYTADSGEGRFVAGFIKFPDSIQPAMQKQIRTDPGSQALHSLLTGTVAEFAKGGGAKITDPNFGIDQGLPTEFVTLKTEKLTLRVHVYVGTKATYMFVTTGSAETASRYFSSIRLEPEVGKNP